MKRVKHELRADIGGGMIDPPLERRVAFKTKSGWVVCERLETVGEELQEGAAYVVHRRKRGKGQNLSIRTFSNSGPQAGAGWLAAADGDPAERYLRADDKSIKTIWLVCLEYRYSQSWSRASG